MRKLTKDEEKAFKGWSNTRRLRARQAADVGKASGRLALARLLDGFPANKHPALPSNLPGDAARVQAAKLRAVALGRLVHSRRSLRVTYRNLVRLYQRLRKGETS